MKHTKGPWGAGQLAGRDAFHVMSDSFTVADVYREEDARLIAAAPELLEALEKARSALLCLSGDGWNDEIRDSAIDAVETAIAKARGEK